MLRPPDELDEPPPEDDELELLEDELDDELDEELELLLDEDEDELLLLLDDELDDELELLLDEDDDEEEDDDDELPLGTEHSFTPPDTLLPAPKVASEQTKLPLSTL